MSDFSLSQITNKDRLDLKNIMTNIDEYEDNTAQIRKVKHSISICDDVNVMEKLKVDHHELFTTNLEEFDKLAQSRCSFLHSTYPDIYRKNLKNEINLLMLANLLRLLSKIENAELNQEEGSILLGKLLKDLYLDSAVRHADNLDGERASDAPKHLAGKPISWAKYRAMKAQIEVNLAHAAAANI